MSVTHQRSFLESRVHQIFSVQMHTHALLKKHHRHNCDATQQAPKSMTMAMARWDTTTMMMVMNVYDDKDNTASCEAAARREAEAGPSIRNNQTMRGENGRKLATTTPGTVTMPPSTTMSPSPSSPTPVAPLPSSTSVDDDNNDGGYNDGNGATMATVTRATRHCCA